MKYVHEHVKANTCLSVRYDVIGADKIPSSHESIIDVNTRTRVKHEIIGKEHHASLALYVFLSGSPELH
jgi:hypothetical protein